MLFLHIFPYPLNIYAVFINLIYLKVFRPYQSLYVLIVNKKTLLLLLSFILLDKIKIQNYPSVSSHVVFFSLCSANTCIVVGWPGNPDRRTNKTHQVAPHESSLQVTTLQVLPENGCLEDSGIAESGIPEFEFWISMVSIIYFL